MKTTLPHPQRLIVPSLRAAEGNGQSRVEVVIGGEPLWFESCDAPLRPAPESVASALLIAALGRGQQLVLDDPLDSQWLNNSHQLIRTLHKWWGYPELPPSSAAKSFAEREPKARNAGIGLYFTGGVDSFHSLLRGGLNITHAVFVHGYDIPLSDTSRMAGVQRMLSDVRDSLPIQTIVVRTNLREHPAFRDSNWEHAHGGALAGIGHLLGDIIGLLVISSSYTYWNFHPWGSSWLLDSFWSSRSVRITHGDASLWRAEKLAEISREPLVRNHLRVCWENLSPSGNCGICEKCIRTMVSLELAGELQDFPAFEIGMPLAELIDRAKPLNESVISVYEMFLERDLDSQIKAAIRRWLNRSRLATHKSSWWRRILVRG